MDIMGGSKEDAASLKRFQVMAAVVDQHIPPQHMLVSQEDAVAPVDKGKMLVQPLVFFDQGVGELHGCGCHVYLVLVHKFPHDLLAVGNRFELPEKAGFEVVLPDAFPVFRYLLPDLPAHALGSGKGSAVTLVVTPYVGAIRVSHHLIHVYKDCHGAKYSKKGQHVKISGVKTALYFRVIMGVPSYN